MSIDEFKQTIEQRVGVPANHLTGETAEENIAQAKVLLACSQTRSRAAGDVLAEIEKLALLVVKSD